MMSKAWPILDLDGDATEADVRRAYAAQLRRYGPDADGTRFAALRAEYESALTRARSRTAAGPRAGNLRIVRTARFASPDIAASDDAEPVAANERALREIRERLVDGDVLGACDRYDLARTRGDVRIEDEQDIELMLARSALADAAIDNDALAALARRYRWDDAVSRFPLGDQIVARYRPQPSAPRPGERYIGQWNWGAFCLTPFWLIAHRRRLSGVLFLIFAPPLCLSVIGFFAAMAWAARCGRNGNAIAVRYRTFTSDEQFVAVQNAWRNWGIPVFALLAAGAFVVMLALVDAAHPGR